MSEPHWAIFALRDIQNAIDEERFEIASHHINDAIAAILAIQDEESETTKSDEGHKESQH